MKKYLYVSLLIGLLFIVGCGNSIKRMEPNITFNNIKVYVPSEYAYSPELRGLIYSENERKLFIKGDYRDRSEAIIIELLKTVMNSNFDSYVETLNNNISTVKYKKIQEEPKMYLREKYEGKSGDTIIYSYTYLTSYNNILYSITVSGPQAKEKELNELRTTVLYSLRIDQ